MNHFFFQRTELQLELVPPMELPGVAIIRLSDFPVSPSAASDGGLHRGVSSSLGPMSNTASSTFDPTLLSQTDSWQAALGLPPARLPVPECGADDGVGGGGTSEDRCEDASAAAAAAGSD